MQENNVYKAPLNTNQVKKKPNTILTWFLSIATALLLGAILFGMLMPRVTVVRGEIPIPTCMRNIRGISLAMLNYSSSRMRLPYASTPDEDGKPIHSWRVSLLPFMEQENLYNQYSFDEPWDGPNNSKLHSIVVPTYRCPDIASSGDDVFGTNYLVVTGKGTAFDGTKKVSAKEVTDGMSNTLAVVEVKNVNTHWMEPVDITLDEMITRFSDKELAASYCVHPGEIRVALLDGSVRRLSVPIDADELRNLIEIADGNSVNVEDFEIKNVEAGK